MRFSKIISFVILCCFSTLLFSQDIETKIPLIQDTVSTNSHFDSDRIINFEKQQINSSEFNQGLISDPFLLLQGRVAGLQIYNRGGDPNEQSLARIRGLSSLDSDIQPLIVVDDIPNVDLEIIDPNDIESIEIVKTGFEKAQYGARGANGVIKIKTKGHKADSLISVKYYGNFGGNFATRDIQILNTNDFLLNGGTDFGSDNNYLSEIKRTGISHAHGLTLSKGSRNYNFRISGNYRNTQGILQESGFKKYNGSANLSFNLLEDKLNISLNGKMTSKNQNLSFKEAFRYGVTINPTFPVFAKDSPFPYNEETFGGYFEPLGLFDAYNPIALLDLNRRQNDNNVSFYSASVNYEILDGFIIGTHYAQENETIDFEQYGPETSNFFGRSIEGVRRGFGLINESENNFVFSDTYLQYRKEIEGYRLNLKAGYSYQEFDYFSSGFSYLWPDLTTVLQSESSNGSDKLISFYNKINVVKNDKLFLDFGIRYEGSSLLKNDSKWQFYPSVQVAYDLGSITAAENDKLLLSGGFGVTGSQNDIYEPNLQFILDPIYLVEKNQEFDIGVSYVKNDMHLNLDVFTRKTSNVNISGIIEFPDPYADISTSGFEIEVGAKIIDNNVVSYSSNLLLSHYKSTVDYEFKINYASPGGPGFGSASLLVIGDGLEFGQIYAPVFEGVDADGFTIYEDVNGDGEIKVFSPGEEDSDYANVGNAAPDFELGWQHNLKIYDYDINVLFRGAFGHSLINLNRMFYENNTVINEVYNTINTSKAIDGLNEARYSSFYVEDASFVKLDNLSISRSFPVGSTNRKMRISLIGQNLLTITGYTGSDPEPSFYDFDGAGYFSPGIDRRTNYRPSRTISLGISLDLN